MHQRRLLVIGFVAIVFAAGMTFIAYRTLVGKVSGMKQPSRVVVVATKDLGVGTMVADGDVTRMEVPIAAIPSGALTDPNKVIGRGVVAAMSRNELIQDSKLAAERAGAGLPAMIPKNMRAVSVQVNDVISVAGFVVPGTRVDVLLTGTPSKVGNNDVMTTTVLENVEVLAAGQKIEPNGDGKPEKVPVITLLVSPEDAQRLTLANSEGKIQLTLRNPLDGHQDSPDPVRNAALYKQALPEAPKVKKIVAKKVVPPAEMVYSVEVIHGDKRDTAHF